MSTVVVTAGKEFKDHKALWAALDAARPSLVVHGGCDLVEHWAESRGIECVREPTLWRQGLLAAHWRNIRMLEKHQPALVIAGPGGAETQHLVRHAHLRNITVNSLPEDLPERVGRSTLDDRRGDRA